MRLRVWLVVVLALLAFETGRHSVHHLWSLDPSCVLASAAAHGSLVEPDAVAVRRIVPVLLGLVSDPAFAAISFLPAEIDRGRAPPVRPSA